MQTSNDETMKFAATWLELKYNMLSDIRQKKDKQKMISLSVQYRIWDEEM